MRRAIILFGGILLLIVGVLWHVRQEPSAAWWMVIEMLRNGNADIYVMRPDERIISNISNHRRNDNGPDWSPERQSFIFTSNRGRDWDIYRTARDGSDIVRLTDYERNDLNPVWSPDGAWIAFLSYRDDDWDLFLMRWDGTDVRNLTNSHRPDYTPVWSPDGQWIAFVSERDGNREIYKIRPDGSDLQNLTNYPSEDADPDWSPDGRWIVFASDRQDGISEILRMRPDGSAVQFLTGTSFDLESNPHYSPDGKSILYNCLCDLNSTRERIFVMHADGSGTQNVTTHESDILNMEYGPTIDLAWHPEYLFASGIFFMTVLFLHKVFLN